MRGYGVGPVMAKWKRNKRLYASKFYRTSSNQSRPIEIRAKTGEAASFCHGNKCASIENAAFIKVILPAVTSKVEKYRSPRASYWPQSLVGQTLLGLRVSGQKAAEEN